MSLTTQPPYILALGASIILLLIPWSLGGALEQEEGGGGHGGAEEGATPGEFAQKTSEFIADYTNATSGLVEAFPRSMEDMGGKVMAPTVYIMVAQWSFTPATLVVKAGVEYEFKFMAMDVTHGASINTAAGSRMVRLPPLVEVELELTFDEPGELVLYCSFYCGANHDAMSGKILVVD